MDSQSHDLTFFSKVNESRYYRGQVKHILGETKRLLVTCTLNLSKDLTFVDLGPAHIFFFFYCKQESSVVYVA